MTVADDGLIEKLKASLAAARGELPPNSFTAQVVREADKQAATLAAADAVGTYMGLKAQIDALEERKAAVRETIEQLLTGEPGETWEFPGLATVTVVKGRVSEKLDRAKLARAGISADVLDEATVRTEGKPSLRITEPEEEDDGE